jgi:hypothetical protein
MSITRMALVAAAGLFLGVVIFFLQVLPQLYDFFERPMSASVVLSQLGWMLLSLATASATMWFCGAVAIRPATVRRAALVAALFYAVNLALAVPMRPASFSGDAPYYRWLFCTFLTYFAWTVFLIQFVRDPAALERVETRGVAAVLAGTGFINGIWMLVSDVTIVVRAPSNVGPWFAPDTPFWRMGVIALWIGAGTLEWLGPCLFFVAVSLARRPYAEEAPVETTTPVAG